MANVIYSTSNAAGVDVNLTYTVPQTNYPEYAAPPFAPGTNVVGTDGSAWVFVKTTGALVAGAAATITNTTAGTTTAVGITTTNGAFGNLVGVAPVAIASGDYGWLQVKGRAWKVRVAASCLPNAQLATTATSGVLDDAITTGGKKVNGIIVLATQGASVGAVTCPGTLDYPVVYTTY